DRCEGVDMTGQLVGGWARRSVRSQAGLRDSPTNRPPPVSINALGEPMRSARGSSLPKWRLTFAILAALALAVTGALAAPAEAAFPGGNGKIAFTTDRDGNNEIYLVKPDSTGLTRLTNNPASDSDPAWSPDG